MKIRTVKKALRAFREDRPTPLIKKVTMKNVTYLVKRQMQNENTKTKKDQ